MTTLYIAGPMTGLPEFNFPAFYDAQAVLEKAGYTVLNPADRAGRTKDMTWDWYLRRGIHDVTIADGVATLEGWERSRGAQLEVAVARGLDMPVAYISSWLAVSKNSKAVSIGLPSPSSSSSSPSSSDQE